MNGETTPAAGGEIMRLSFTPDVEARLVRLEFGALVRWVAIDAHGARQMALGLLRAASQIDGKTLHIRTE